MADIPMAAARFGGFELRPAQRCLLAGGSAVAIGARAFDVLVALFERRDRVVSKSELIDLVWPGLVVEDNNLQQQISSLRKLLGPTAIATVPGQGYRFTADVSAATPLAPGTPNNLPHERSRFIGRETALADCARLLHGARLLTLTGIGGCGKTRLALQLAQRELDAFAAGIWFVDLAPVQDAQRVAATVAAAFGVREDAGAPLPERLAAHLAGPPRVIVLDNCEHVVDAVVELAAALLAACRDLRIVATSREALGIGGEQVYPVRSLGLPAGAGLDAMLDCEAVRVFADRARLALPGFEVDAGNAATIAEICVRLDGIALAIELAAARVPMLGVDEIRDRLGDRFRLLTGGRSALPRHQTLQAAMQWSYEHLAPPEQVFLCQLSVFPAGCTLDAARAVAASDDDYAVLGLLTALHDKSLLLVDRDGDGPPRYHMLETVRQYAQERLDTSGSGDAARDRALRHAVAVAEQAARELTGAHQGRWMARLRADQENLLAALAWSALAPDGTEPGLRLAGALWRYWVGSAQLERGHGIAVAALRRAGEGADPAARCRVLLGLGQIAYRMGRYDETLACAEQGLALARQAADPAQRAFGLGLQANGLSATDRHVAAVPRFVEACEIARTIGDRFLLATLLNNLAEVQRGHGRLADAEASYREALGIGGELKNAGITAIVACNLARLLVADGRHERARTQLIECQAIAETAGLTGLGEDWLEVGATLAGAVGDHASAALLHGASLARMQDAGARREPVDDAVIAPLMARSRKALGPAAFDAAEARGRSLSYEASMTALKEWLERPS